MRDFTHNQLTAVAVMAILFATQIRGATAADAVVAVGPFVGDFVESWEGFANYQENPNRYETSPAIIFGGHATIANPLMTIYEPSAGADFHLLYSGPAQVADGAKGMGLDGGSQTATIDFVTPVFRFGAYWGAASGATPQVVSVSFVDTDGTLIDTVTFEYTRWPASDGLLEWHGWESTTAVGAITYTGSYVVIDAMQASETAPCPWDCGGDDGVVGIGDFLALLAQWGGPGDCDSDGGGVGISDFQALLANWGPCAQ